MNIALLGATGMIGSRLAAEALARGHTVTAVVRDPARLVINHPNLTVVTGDAQDTARLAEQIAGHDAVIGSLAARREGDASLVVAAARSLLAAARQTGVRLAWVGGASSLEVAPGVRLFDTPEFPDAYRAEAQAGIDVLALLRGSEGVEWTYLSPSLMIGPGERTGRYQLGGDQLLTDAAGQSAISAEDYAVALIDELETPKHRGARFTVANM